MPRLLVVPVMLLVPDALLAQSGAAEQRPLTPEVYATYDVQRDRPTRITDDLPTTFVDVESDRPAKQKPPFGVAGWTRDDGAVLLYDEYDIWRVRPDGSEAERLRRGAEDSVRHRYRDLKQEKGFGADFIDPNASLYRGQSPTDVPVPTTRRPQPRTRRRCATRHVGMLPDRRRARRPR